MFIGECFELVIFEMSVVLLGWGISLHTGPAIKDPMFNTVPSFLCLVFSLVPAALDLSDQAIFVVLCRFLNLETFLLNVRLELRGVPFVVWGDNVALPVLLDKIFEKFAVSRGWVGDVIIREPSLELGFVPVVVDWTRC